jgi:hypothetical protein
MPDSQQPAQYSGPERRQGDSEIEINGPAGIRGVWKNPSSSAVLLIILAAFFYWISWQGEQKADLRHAEILTQLKAFQTAIVAEKDAQDAMIYELSLNQTDRERLNLSKPKLLSDMQR